MYTAKVDALKFSPHCPQQLTLTASRTRRFCRRIWVTAPLRQSSFFQLNDLFQRLTSIMTARIEGNRTPILEAVVGDSRRRISSETGPLDDGVQEILYIQEAIDFIEERVRTSPCGRAAKRKIGPPASRAR